MAPWIDAAWSVHTKPGDSSLIHPDNGSDIIRAPGEGLKLVGPMTRSITFTATQDAVHFGVRFHPGHLARHFGLPAVETVDCSIPLDQLASSAQYRQLEELPTVAALLDYWQHRARPLAPDPLERALEHLRHHQGRPSLDWLATQANLSPRQFRRRTIERTGLGPKFLARVYRLQSALLLRQQHPHWTWATIAAQAGYSDQPHLIREFRQLTGNPPERMSVLSNS